MNSTRFFACFLLLVTAFSASAQDTYRTYRNARFGTSVQYPANLLLPQRESDNGDGRKFLSRDGRIELSVFGFNNVRGHTPTRELRRAVRDWRRDGSRITYQKAGSNWFVLSGYVGKDIFYEKTLLRNNVFHTLIWQYPPDLKQRLDAPVTRSVRTFGTVRPTATASITVVPTAPPRLASPPPTPLPPTSAPAPRPTRIGGGY